MACIEVPAGKNAHTQFFGNAGHDACLGWNLFNIAQDKVKFCCHYTWFRTSSLALHSMPCSQRTMSLRQLIFFISKGDSLLKKNPMPAHKMRKDEEDMDIDVDHINVDKQLLSTAEAVAMYGNDLYEEFQQY